MLQHSTCFSINQQAATESREQLTVGQPSWPPSKNINGSPAVTALSSTLQIRADRNIYDRLTQTISFSQNDNPSNMNTGSDYHFDRTGETDETLLCCIRAFCLCDYRYGSRNFA
jgi:hypothetical protein